MTDLSVTEYTVLGVLAERPSHGFAIAKELGAEGDLGRIFTVRRPQVYRALDRLVDRGLAAPIHTERGDAGPERLILVTTPRGEETLRHWLTKPVNHVRDIRIEFLLKVALLERSGTSPVPLIREQRLTLQSTFAALDETETRDHVEKWRRHNARAAASYLEELEAFHGQTRNR